MCMDVGSYYVLSFEPVGVMLILMLVGSVG
jgi:hypothetical protein